MKNKKIMLIICGIFAWQLSANEITTTIEDQDLTDNAINLDSQSSDMFYGGLGGYGAYPYSGYGYGYPYFGGFYPYASWFYPWYSRYFAYPYFYGYGYGLPYGG